MSVLDPLAARAEARTFVRWLVETVRDHWHWTDLDAGRDYFVRSPAGWLHGGPHVGLGMCGSNCGRAADPRTVYVSTYASGECEALGFSFAELWDECCQGRQQLSLFG